MNKKLEDLIDVARLSDLLEKKEEKKTGKKIGIALAVIGAITVIAGICFVVYRYLTPDYFMRCNCRLQVSYSGLFR